MAIDNNKKNKTKLPNKKRKSTSSKKKSNGFLTYLKRTFLVLLFLGLTVMVIAAGYVFAILKSTPPLDVEAVTRLSAPSTVCDNEGKVMDNVHSEIDRTIVEYDKIPQNLKDAVTSIEDQRFYSHHGVDPIRIAGSIVTDVTKILKRQTGMHGGSTLTQQLLKNTVLANENSAIERKIKEIWLALNLEKHLSKDEILNQYLNTIPVGGTSYGVEAGALLYFGKHVNELNLVECAYIAGVTQAPTYYSAYTEANKKDPTPYKTRTKSVLTKMNELGKITDDEYKTAISQVDNNGLDFHSKKTSYNLEYEWYINPTLAQVKADLIDKYKYTSEEASKLLANGGLKIMSNMDRTLQEYTQDLLNNYSASNIGAKETYIEGTNTPEFQASATIVDYKTGKVLALIGGRGEHSAQSTNRAYNYLRPIGSTAKPLVVYGPALNEKVITAATTIDDTPIGDTIAKKYASNWDPKNDDKLYAGNVSVREGLRQSKNVVAISVEDILGMKTGISYGEKFGLIYNDASKTSMAAVALGQFNADNDGGNTFITSSAFGVFGNGGTYVEPKLYSKVYDASGNVILDTESELKTTEIFSPQTAYIMYDMLKGSAGYTGTNAIWGNMPVAGKTGTTTDKQDLWFTGITPYLSGSIWLGYDTPKSMSGGSSNNAAALWGKIMKKAHEGKSVTDIEKPSGIVEREVCIDSGKLATSLCKSDHRSTGSRVYTEMFIEGTEPTTSCDAHVQIDVNKFTNKLASSHTPSFLITKKIFVKKSKPNSATADYQYLLPSEYDDGYGYGSYEEENNGYNNNDHEDEDEDRDNDNNDNNNKPNKNEKPNSSQNNNSNLNPSGGSNGSSNGTSNGGSNGSSNGNTKPDNKTDNPDE